MAIEQDRGAAGDHDPIEAAFDRGMIRRMGSGDSRGEVGQTDGAMPQMAVKRGPAGNDAKAGLGARRCGRRGIGDNGGVNLVRCPVAIDGGARRRGDHRAKAERKGTPRESIDQRILETFERGPSAGRIGKQPIGIIAARMRHRQQDRQIAARRDDDR